MSETEKARDNHSGSHGHVFLIRSIRSQTLYPAELRVHVSLETCRIIAPLRGFVNHKLKDSGGYNLELFDYFGVFVPKVFKPKVT